MSSILKALKKLENEFPEKSEARFWQQTKPKGMSSHKGVSGGLRLKKNFFLILASLVIAFSIGLALNLKPWHRKPTVVSKIQTPPAKVLSVPEKEVSEKGPVRKSSTLETDIKDSKPIKGPTKKTSEFYDAIGANGLSSVEKTETKPLTPLSLSKEKTSRSERIQQEAVNDKPGEKYGQQTKAEGSASIPVKQAGESKLELQAIAWSSDPKSRLAVINGRVVREGESIDRVNIMHIGKDEVIFKKGMEEWKQLFGF
ncbi:MAG TPA: general secretion pathway protein GspB [Desulfobacterales bacterium]|nr:general secretion pathway protein GspB [Desulfobacterales bacterium]